MKTGERTTPQMDQNQQKGLMGALFRSAKKAEDEAARDITQKMSSALQETLLRNIQLQDDIATIGNELKTLSEENKRLKLLNTLK
jgi:polyhydroxyalkanoate synthesis regulator phasin